jgi:rRNA maturation protein Nop10
MEIIACPNCGSKKIFQGTMGDGVLTGYTTRSVCKNCGYQGMPIIFDTEENYQKFLKEKKTLSKKKEIKKKIKKYY